MNIVRIGATGVTGPGSNGVCKKRSTFPGHERSIAENLSYLVLNAVLARKQHFPDLQDTNHIIMHIFSRSRNKIN